MPFAEAGNRSRFEREHELLLRSLQDILRLLDIESVNSGIKLVRIIKGRSISNK